MEVTQNLPEVGQKYHVDHRRKGKFDLEVTVADSEFTTGILLAGFVRTVSTYPPEIGDSMTIRTSTATFTLIT